MPLLPCHGPAAQVGGAFQAGTENKQCAVCLIGFQSPSSNPWSIAASLPSPSSTCTTPDKPQGTSFWSVLPQNCCPLKLLRGQNQPCKQATSVSSHVYVFICGKARPPFPVSLITGNPAVKMMPSKSSYFSSAVCLLCSHFLSQQPHCLACFFIPSRFSE